MTSQPQPSWFRSWLVPMAVFTPIVAALLATDAVTAPLHWQWAMGTCIAIWAFFGVATAMAMRSEVRQNDRR